MNPGRILLVGFGPGAREHMSLRAREAIAEADVVIGYTTYIRLVADLLDGKEVIRKGMTEEIDRCVEAYEQARAGRTVALVSSGDIGIYGMAGPTYEVLLQAGWRPGDGIEVEVVPGSTALSACAALVGAPLTHDFCSISLSDLLTPWPVIARRLEAAGRGDFVVALYNPKSGRRTRQICEAQRILLRHRSPETPVAIVKSAYRRRQSVRLVRLDEMKDCEIGMLTTVLVGNSQSFAAHGLMITPRGYANKYEALTGATRAGERAGRSLNMGLEGWRDCLREAIERQDVTSLPKIARQFDVPIGEVLDALAEAPAGGFEAARTTADADTLLAAARKWGRLRAVLRSPGGAIAELLLEAQAFSRRGDWLTIETPEFHLHVDAGRIARACFVRRGERLRGLHFLDDGDEAVFNLSLVREDGHFDPAAEAAYAETWRTLAEARRSSDEPSMEIPS